MRSAALGLIATLALAATPALAVPVWATWTVDNATTATATIPGHTATFTFTGSPTTGGGESASPAVTPALPGIPSGNHPGRVVFFPTANDTIVSTTPAR